MTQSTTRSLRRAFLCLTAVFAPLTLPAATINVPVQQKTIQAGIDASSDGDTVLVAPGTYYENIDFKGKAITVTSSGGAAVTTIDGGNKPGVATVLFANGETSASVISKLTIRGGGDALVSGGSGVGGIYVNQASPTIQNNTVTANYCYNIGVEFGTATISGNEISGVLQSQGQSYCFYGGGIFLGGTPDSLTGLGSVVEGNTIENNLAGSGISMWAAQNVLIMNNIIRGNISPEPGSAFTSANSTRTAIVQNIIYGNTSTCGGALAFQDGKLVDRLLLHSYCEQHHC